MKYGKIAIVLLLAFAGSACTIPSYQREVTRIYDGDGKLIQTQVKETVNQADPNTKPLLPVLENQTYQP